MEDLIKRTVLAQEKQKCGSKKAKIEVFVMAREEDVETFIKKTLQSFSGQYNTFNCTSKKDQEKGYYKYNCTRYGSPKQKSYRSVGCKAYVSFQMNYEWQGHTVIVQRVFDQHTNHSTTDPSDGHSNCMVPELKKKIEELLALGTKPDIILSETHKWARSMGNTNIHDRSYFATPRDIDNVRTGMMRRKRFHCNDSDSVEGLLHGPLQEHVVFYQAYTPNQELIIVLQTPMMRRNLEEHGKQLVFVDTTHCVNQYEFPLLTLAVRDSHGRGVPVAYAIVSNERQNTLEKVLEELRKQSLCPPRAFMVDKDYAEINALSSIFPESAILLCWYHVMQAVQRWLSKIESGVHGPSNSKSRDDIIAFFHKLKDCQTKAEFATTGKKFCETFQEYPAVCQYFQRNWEDIGHMWANYGRCFEHSSSDTNNIIERFFRRLKYQFLGGIRNRRVDDLINVLMGKAEEYFSIMRDLQCAGRVKTKHSGATTDSTTQSPPVQSVVPTTASITPASATVSCAVEKLNSIRNTVADWKEIPQSIEDMIENLHRHVLKANDSYPATANKSRKVRPLFPSRRQKVDAGGRKLTDYPVKKRRSEKNRKCR